MLYGTIVVFVIAAMTENETLFKPLLAALAIQSIRIYLVNSKYKIDFEEKTFQFPRSDIENSIFQIIIGARYWNLMRNKTINLNEIENIYLDTKRWETKTRQQIGTHKDGKSRYGTVTKKHVRYRLNIAGAFGSVNLSFLERQKRDEVRNALQQAVKDLSGRNIDRKIAEFS